MAVVKRLNLMDAVKVQADTVSRARTAVIRRGVVTTAPDASGLTKVALGGGTVDAVALKSFVLQVGDQVAVLADTDAYWIAGVIGAAIAPVQSSARTLNVAAAATASLAVVFPRPFAATPSVFTNLSVAAGVGAGWISRATAVTATGFTIYLSGASATFTATVDWLAVERTTPPS